MWDLSGRMGTVSLNQAEGERDDILMIGHVIGLVMIIIPYIVINTVIMLLEG